MFGYPESAKKCLTLPLIYLPNFWQKNSIQKLRKALFNIVFNPFFCWFLVTENTILGTPPVFNLYYNGWHEFCICVINPQQFIAQHVRNYFPNDILMYVPKVVVTSYLRSRNEFKLFPANIWIFKLRFSFKETTKMIAFEFREVQ